MDDSETNTMSTSDDSDAQSQDGASDPSTAPAVARPSPDYVKAVLDGLEPLTKLVEAAAIIADAEAVLAVAEPLGGVLTVVEMIVNVWEALELPERTCSYQGLCYGLMNAALGLDDPQPNPGWPGADAAPDGVTHFTEGVNEAKKRLGGGQEGVKNRNLILLAIAKSGEKPVVNQLWQHAISDDDHLLKMFTIEWPNVGPNG